MSEVKLKWRNASADNPGFTVWYATPERDENVLYAIRRKRAKRGFKPTGWRVFVRSDKDAPLKTIFVGQTLDGKDGAKTFVQDLEEVIRVSATLESAPTV